MHSWSCSFFTVGSGSSSTNILFHPFVILTGLLIDIKSILLFFIHVHVFILLSKKENKNQKFVFNFFFYKMVSFLFHSAITRIFPNFISNYVTKNCRWNDFFFKKEKKTTFFYISYHSNYKTIPERKKQTNTVKCRKHFTSILQQLNEHFLIYILSKNKCPPPPVHVVSNLF